MSLSDVTNGTPINEGTAGDIVDNIMDNSSPLPSGTVQHGGDHDVFSDSTQWTKVQNKKKRKYNSKSSTNSSTSTVDIERFKNLTVDDKLGVLFQNSNSHVETMGKIEANIDACLQLQSDVVEIEFRLNSSEDISYTR